MKSIRLLRPALAAAVLFGLATPALAPPVFRPPPPPPRPVFRPGPRPGIMPRPGFVPGRNPGFRPAPRRTPAQVHADIQHLIRTRPADAFGRLNGAQAHVLSPAQRALLGRQAVTGLALNLGERKKAWPTLAAVRRAGRQAEGLDPSVRQDLQLLAWLAERQALAEALGQVGDAGRAGRWDQAATLARGFLDQLSANDPWPDRGAGPESTARREARDVLSAVWRDGQKWEALKRFQDDLARGDTHFRAVVPGRLPLGLRTRLNGLRALEQVRELATRRWLRPPDVDRLGDSVRAFEAGIAGLPDVDAKLGRQLLQGLAVKALLEGHAEAFTLLWPNDGPPEYAAVLLHDLKALTLGEGKVATWPARVALPAAPGKDGDAAPAPPPGLRPLIPEDARAGWRAPERAKTPAVLSPLDKAAALGRVMQTKAAAEAKPERTRIEAELGKALEPLEGLRRRLVQWEAADRERLGEVERLLGRKLKPEEAARTRLLVARKKTDKEIVSILNPGPPMNDR